MELFYDLIIMYAQQQPAGWMVLLGGLLTSGILTAVLNFWFNRRKTDSETEKIDADAADIIQRAAGELIQRIQEQAKITQEQAHRENQQLQDQNRELLQAMLLLKKEVEKIPELELMIRELQEGVKMLTEQLIEHGIHPIYPPLPGISSL